MLGLNELFLAFTMVANVVNVVLFADAPINNQPLNQIVAVSFHEGQGWWAKECKFQGVMVPFVREWEEDIDTILGKQVLPPEPNKVAGYVFMLNKKVCPGKESEPLALVAVRQDIFAGTPKEYRINAVDLRGVKNPAEQYKWLPQVLKAMDAGKDVNPAVQEFIKIGKN